MCYEYMCERARVSATSTTTDTKISSHMKWNMHEYEKKNDFVLFKCKTMRIFLKSVNGEPADDYIDVVVDDYAEQYVCGFLINCSPKKNRLL